MKFGYLCKYFTIIMMGTIVDLIDAEVFWELIKCSLISYILRKSKIENTTKAYLGRYLYA